MTKDSEFQLKNALKNCKAFLEFPSISTSPSHKNDLHHCAEWLKNYLIEMGFKADLYPTAGHPAVIARWHKAEGAPTVLLYGHYDVQPVEPLELWETPPFTPNIRDGYLYARGASDDKGQVFCHIWALRQLLEKDGKLPLNVTLLIEGEEEIGSPHLMDVVTEHQELLKADFGLVSDTPMFAPGMPSICIGLRGLTYMEMVVQSTTGDLHSGQQGGALLNPIHALAKMITQLKNDEGKIQIPGFYDDVLEMPAHLREQIAKLPFDEQAYQEELGATDLVGEKGYSTLERRWFRPTLDCNGIVGGYIQEGAKTVIPAKASAKFSMRLVPNQDPKKIEAMAKDYLKSIKPKGVTLTFIDHHGGHAYRVNPDHPVVDKAKAALKIAYGKDAVFQAEGGSIPVLPSMQAALGIDFILMGFNHSNDNIHAPNERFSLECFEKGIIAAHAFYSSFKK